MEQLENRILLAIATKWIGGAGGDWSVAANWDNGAPVTNALNTYIAVFDGGPAAVITIDANAAGHEADRFLVKNGSVTLNMAAATFTFDVVEGLQVAPDANSSASLTISGGGKLTTTSFAVGSGASSSGTLTVSGPSTFLKSGTYSRVADGDSSTSTLAIDDEATVEVNGVLSTGDALGASGTITVSGAGSLLNIPDSDILLGRFEGNGKGVLTASGGATIVSNGARSEVRTAARVLQTWTALTQNGR